MCDSKNASELRKIADKKKNYGMKQAKVVFSESRSYAFDRKAIEGKRILEEKILGAR